jgi:phosphatidylglycerol:prolipoprotein diacylglycerol transferase
MILGLTYPSFDPIAFEIGPLAIRWYALSYIAGILLAWIYCRRLTRLPPKLMTPATFDDFMAWAVLGVVIGGRLGYILFYRPHFYLAEPLEILKIWQGGMSFHGGLVGVLLAMLIFARRRGIPYLALTDIVGAAAPIGLLLGRIANFVNGELYGRVTDVKAVPWAMVFPGGGPQHRHPSQLYEAGLEGLLLFLVLSWMVRFGALLRSGLISGAFMLGYGLSRFVVEYFREPDQGIALAPTLFSMGQLLSLPMILLGLGLLFWAVRSRAHAG